MSLAPLTPETEVWVSTARSGISYHLIRDEGRKTICGRYLGGTRNSDGFVTDPVNGHVMTLADAMIRFDSAACSRCTGSAEVVPPRVGP